MNHQELRLRGIKLQDLGTMQSYLTEHTKKNPDADLSLSYMNHAIENLSSEQLESRVTDRIAQLHLKKRPRWDSIGIEDILVSPSEEFMDKVELCFREEYFQDSLHFFQSRYGKENVMYCQCHMDETEPHIHVGIVPVTSEGQLSATKLFTYQEIKLMASKFHKDVAEGYTLKCAEHYLNEYLEAHSAKVDQLTLKLKILSNNIGDAEEKQKELDRISKTVKTFIGEDNIEYSELATSDYKKLLQMAQDAVWLRKIVIELHHEFIECELENIRIGMAIECLCAKGRGEKDEAKEENS